MSHNCRERNDMAVQIVNMTSKSRQKQTSISSLICIINGILIQFYKSSYGTLNPCDGFLSFYSEQGKKNERQLQVPRLIPLTIFMIIILENISFKSYLNQSCRVELEETHRNACRTLPRAWLYQHGSYGAYGRRGRGCPQKKASPRPRILAVCLARAVF